MRYEGVYEKRARTPRRVFMQLFWKLSLLKTRAGEPHA
jgi:hypothetical protein